MEMNAMTTINNHSPDRFADVDLNSLSWPNWFCDKNMMDTYIKDSIGRFGYSAIPFGFVTGGRIPVVDSEEECEIVMFVRSDGHGWELTDRLLVPCAGGKGGRDYWKPPYAMAKNKCWNTAIGGTKLSCLLFRGQPRSTSLVTVISNPKFQQKHERQGLTSLSSGGVESSTWPGRS